MKKNLSFKRGLFALLTPTLMAISGLSQAQVAATCVPTYSSGCTLGDNIDGVTLVGASANLSNLATPCPTGGYQDYTTSTTLGVPDMLPSQNYSGTVSTTYTSASEYVTIWVDWDDNGVFATTEQVAAFGPIGGTGTGLVGAYTIAVPAGATPGIKRMRVGLSWNTALTGPCGSSSYGETHDYKVQVLSLSPCVNPPVAGTATVTPAGQSCPGFTVQLGLSGIVMGGGQTYEWESSPNNTVYTSTGPSSLGPTKSVSPLVTTWYRCKVICSGGTAAYSTPVQISVAAGLAGTYTVNSAVATGGTNFSSFTALANALNCGIVAPVTVNVVAGSGPYTDTFYLNAIGGASAANKVRINGNGETIQYTPTSTTNGAQRIVSLNGTQYLTIDSLKIKSLSNTYGWGVYIGGNAKYDTISRCDIDLSAITGNSSVNANGIVMSGSTTSPTTACAATNLYILNNRVIAGSNVGSGGGYYGIAFNGVSSTVLNDSIFVNGNEVSNFYYYGIRYAYVKNGELNNNNIHRSAKTAVATSAYGIYAYYCTGIKVVGNKIHDFAIPGVFYNGTFYGMYNYHYNNTAATPILVANNIVYNMGTYQGIQYFTYTYGPYINFYHNTVDASIPTGTTGTGAMYGCYVGYNTGSQQKNNIINITGGNTGIKYGFYISSTAYPPDLQKNNVNVASTQTGVQNPYFYSSAYTSLAAFQTANPTQEVGSPSVNPLFVAASTGNLMPTNPAVLASGVNLLTQVPTDIVGTPRSGTPTIGAFEQLPSTINDAAMVSLLSPINLVCAASVPFKVVFRNAGTNNITSAKINWKLNGVVQPVYSYTGTLTPSTILTGQNSDTVVIGNGTLINGLNTIQIWTSLPNGLADITNGNDTLTTTFTTTSFTATAALDTICVSALGPVSLSPATGYGAATIQWQSSPNGTTWTDIAGANAANYSAGGITSQTQFRAKITTSGATCYSTKDTINVVNPALTTTTGARRCGPGTLNLSATSPAGTTIKWYNSPTGGTSLATGGSFTTPLLNSTQTFYATAGTGGGSSTPMTLATTSAGGNGCGGGAMFDINPVSNLSIDSFTAYPTGTSANTVVNVYKKLGTFQGNETTPAAWTLVEAVTVPVLTAGQPFKIPLTVPLNITAAQLTGIYIEYNAQYTNVTTPTNYSNTDLTIITGTGLCSSFGGTNLGRGFNGAVHYRIGSGCESNRTPVVATIDTFPTVHLGNDTAICPGTSTTLNGGSTATGNTYSWSTGASTPAITVNTAGTYILTVNDAHCQSKDTQVVSIAPLPTANLLDTVAICSGSSTTLNAGNPGSTYTWNNGSTNQTLTTNTGGNKIVTVKNSFQCIKKDTTFIVVNPLPIVHLGNDTMVCQGTPLTLNAQNPGATYLWSTAATTQTIQVVNSGNYSVVVTNGFDCKGRDTITINAFVPVSVDGFDFVPRFDLQQGRVDFTPINPNLVDSFHWNFGDGNTSTLQNPSHVYSTSANYLVTLSVSNECGSKDTSLMIYVDLQLGVRFANSADIKIDVYPVPAQESLTIECLASEVKLNSVSIYNAIGQEVVLKQNISNSKTTINTDGLTTGNYFIKIETNKGTAFRRVNILK